MTQRRLPSKIDALEGLRAATWVRVSTAGQTERFGPDAQLEQIRGAVEEHKLVDTGIVWNMAHSGRSIAKTPEWRDMLSRAGRDYDVLVVGYASRFSRDLRTTMNACHDMHEAGAVIVFADDRLLSSDQGEWERLAREAVESQAYSLRLARRVGEGYKAKRRRFGIPGGNKPPYGFIRTQERPQRLLVDPERMAKVRQAFVLSAAGRNDGQVAEALSLEKSHVAEILTNPVYKGTLRTGEPSAAGIQIDPTLWDRVQERRAIYSHRDHGAPALRTYPLAKLLYCGHCGRMLTAHTGRFRHVKACGAFKAARPDNVRWVRGESYDHELYDSIVPSVLAYVAANSDLAKSVMAQTERRVTGPDPATLARIERERDAALDRYRWDRDTQGLASTMSRLDREEEEAKKVVRELPSAQDVQRFLSDLPSLWAASDPEHRQQLARALFERIEVLGVENVRIVPTREALEHGWFEAWRGKTLRVPLDAASLRYGRGERIGGNAFQLTYEIAPGAGLLIEVV